MSAKVDANLSTKTARLKLPVAADHKPYFRGVEPGLSVGYRRTASDKPGTWIVRKWDGKKYTVINLRSSTDNLCIADDYSDADGDHVLSFAQAQTKAKGPRPAKGGFLVSDAVMLYVAHLKADHRSPLAIENAE